MATIHSLKVFICVYQNRNISETARLFYCSQPSVSRIILDLETEFNTVLFERYHRRLIPTPQADQLYRHAERIIMDYQEMEQAMHQKQETIRVGSTVTISNILLPSAIHSFHAENPDIRIEVTVNNGANLQQALMDNRLDVALIEDSLHFPDLQTMEFCKDELVLLVPPSHPLAHKNSISIHDLNGLPFLKRDEGSAVREYTDHIFRENGVQVDTIWQSTSTRAIVNAVREGLGITVLPYQMCTQDIEQGYVIPVTLTDVSLTRHYYVVTHRHKIMTEALSEWIRLLTVHLGHFPLEKRQKTSKLST